MISKLAPSAGKLLISEPFMNDPNFTRSVILLTNHSEEGTIGFVLNHPSLLTLDELIADIEGTSFPVYYGGPVEIDTIHFVHSCPDKITDGIALGKGVYWGGNFETLRALIKLDQISTDEIKFFIGYSGWDAEQLAFEMEENTWIVSDQYDADMVFKATAEQLWREVIIHLGPKYAHVSNFPQNPNLN